FIQQSRTRIKSLTPKGGGHLTARATYLAHQTSRPAPCCAFK
ncbi:hypothetical protein SSYM_1698, partial [Serratia symbiotica str. Tucson]